MTKITEFEHDPGLTALQEAVGGYIELVPYFIEYKVRACRVVCNEEGKMKSLPINLPATDAWYDCLPGDPLDILVGDIAVIYGGMK